MEMSSRHGPGRGINILVASSIVFPMFLTHRIKINLYGQLSMFLKVRTQSRRECVIALWRNGIKIWNASRICVSSLRRGHANLLCIVPILIYVLPEQAR